MAAKAERNLPGARMRGADKARFPRLASWVAVAALAVAGAMAAARSEVGAQRLAAVLGPDLSVMRASAVSHSAPPTRLPLGSSGGAPVSAADADPRGLTEAVRRLSAERERLVLRLEALEEAVETTGSVTRNAPKSPDMSTHARTAAPSVASPGSIGPAPAASPDGRRAPPPPETATATLATAGATTLPVSPPALSAGVPAQEPVSESRPKRPEYAVDLGSAPSIEALRALWLSLKAQQGALLDDLRPLVVTRPSVRSGELELRLVAGPLNNTLMAGRICAVLSATGRLCQTASFEGQRLAAR